MRCVPRPRRKRILACLAGGSAFARKCLADKLATEPGITLIEFGGALACGARRQNQAVIFILAQESTSPVERDLKRIARLSRRARILIIGFRPTRESLFRLLQHGVHGFLDVGEIDSKLVPALQTLAEGHIWVEGDKVAEIAKNNRLASGPKEGRNGFFTAQESRVVSMVLAGYSNKQIGPELGISERTVKFHLGKVFTKLGVTDRHQLASAIQFRKLQGQLSSGQGGSAPSSPPVRETA